MTKEYDINNVMMMIMMRIMMMMMIRVMMIMDGLMTVLTVSCINFSCQTPDFPGSSSPAKHSRNLDRQYFWVVVGLS